MQYQYYKYGYYALILFLLWLCDFMLFFIFFLAIRWTEYVNTNEPEMDLEYDIESYGDIDLMEIDDDGDLLYHDIGLSEEHHESSQEYEESYVLYNNSFRFETYGGEYTLDDLEFIDFTIYRISDERNLKYVYSLKPTSSTTTSSNKLYIDMYISNKYKLYTKR